MLFVSYLFFCLYQLLQKCPRRRKIPRTKRTWYPQLLANTADGNSWWLFCYLYLTSPVLGISSFRPSMRPKGRPGAPGPESSRMWRPRYGGIILNLMDFAKFMIWQMLLKRICRFWSNQGGNWWHVGSGSSEGKVISVWSVTELCKVYEIN